MLQLGVCEIPVRYILRRWTWSAEEDLVVEKPGERAVMPEESRKKMWLHVNCNEFKGLAIGANKTEDGRKLVRMHMKALKKDLAALKRETAKRGKRVNHNPTEATPNQTEKNLQGIKCLCSKQILVQKHVRRNRNKHLRQLQQLQRMKQQLHLQCQKLQKHKFLTSGIHVYQTQKEGSERKHFRSHWT